MAERDPPSMDMPRLFNIFDIPETKSVRATSSLRPEIDLEEVLERVPKARKIRTSGKDVVKFEIGKGKYLLLFPSGYIQISAPNEDSVRGILKAFRNELFENGLLK